MEQSISLRRWLLKKIARSMVAVTSFLLGRVQLGTDLVNSSVNVSSSPSCGSSPSIRVLTYHRFGQSQRDPFCLDLADFEAQMAWLAQTGRAISLEVLEQFLQGRQALAQTTVSQTSISQASVSQTPVSQAFASQTPVSQASVLVTIDDGYQSVRQALPILVKYQIPAVVFLTVSEIRAENCPTRLDQPELDQPEPHLTWADVRELDAAGITVASHGWTHRSLGQLSRPEQEQEAQQSRALLESQLGKPVRAFAYPFGTRADFNAQTAAVLQSSYPLIFTSQHGAIHPGLDATALPRIKVESGEPLWLFQLLACGGLDAWGLIDHTLWRFQQTPAQA